MVRTDNTDNTERVIVVANRLPSRRWRFVLLGGAATELLLTDEGAPPVRPTQDVDVVVEVADRDEFYNLERELRSLGFSQGLDGIICRWVVDGVTVDVMPTDPAILGFPNRWYPDVVRHATNREVAAGVSIHVISAPHFVATKFEAFLTRGKGELLASHDLEDILIVLDGREELESELAASEEALKDFVSAQFLALRQHPSFVDAISGHLPGDHASQDRVPLLVERVRRISELSGRTLAP